LGAENPFLTSNIHSATSWAVLPGVAAPYRPPCCITGYKGFFWIPAALTSLFSYLVF